MDSSLSFSDGSTLIRIEPRMRVFLLYVALLTLLMAGCQKPPMPVAMDHLNHRSDPRQAVEGEIPDIVQTTPFIPPLHPVEERYTIVVFDVPVREVLFTLTRNSRINADIHPSVDGHVTINAVEQTLPAILETISRQVEMVYEFDGKNVIIKPDQPYWHTYKIDYLNMKRESTGVMSLSLETGGEQGVAASGGADVTAKFEMDFWEPVENGIKKIIKVDNAVRTKNKAKSLGALKGGQDAGLEADEEPKKTKDKEKDKEKTADASEDDSLVIHRATGVISVSATQGQHKEIQKFLDMIAATAHQQVLIEATVVEIRLNDYYVHGVDWSRVTGGGSGTSLGIGESVLGEGGNSVIGLIDSGQLTNTFGGGEGSPFFALGHRMKTGAGGNNVISVSLRLLDEFGDVTVLSSPKVMTLNNQTAVMKVGDQHTYFETKYEETSTESDTSTTLKKKGKTTFTKKEALEGLILSVTPNVEESGIVSLHVRPVLSQKIGDLNGPDGNQYPQFQVREMDSVLRVGTGQVVVLGGLMKDFAETRKTGLPGLSDVPFAGELFGTQSRTLTKTEMAIFIRPTIMTPDSMRERMDQIRFSLDPGAVRGDTMKTMSALE
ncbi:MAG: hypothetical protein H7829_12465 [Magnetococcus sp. THC-1_WYH]